MISPELLRRFPFFGHFNDEQMRIIAMHTEQVEVEKDVQIFKEQQAADTFYLLLEGSVDLVSISAEAYHPKQSKEFLMGVINPGEFFALSAFIEPYLLKTGARAAQKSLLLAIDAVTLRQLIESDARLGCVIMKQIAQALMERLNFTRVQLAAAWT